MVYQLAALGSKVDDKKPKSIINYYYAIHPLVNIDHTPMTTIINFCAVNEYDIALKKGRQIHN